MNALDLIGKYATRCCCEDMFLIEDEAAAQECIDWNIEIQDDCPSMMYQFADNLEQAMRMWNPVNQQPAGQDKQT